MRKSLFTGLAVIALAFTIAQAGVGWQLTGGTTLGGGTQSVTITLPGSSGSSSGSSSGGSGAVCSRSGLGGVNVYVTGGKLHMVYSTTTGLGGISAIESAWNSLKNCITTSASTATILCEPNVLAAAAGGGLPTVCFVQFKVNPVKWGHTSQGSGNTVAAQVATCAANLHPYVYVTAPASQISFSAYPSGTWLLNLPVEYYYSNTAPPSLGLGNTSAQCGISISNGTTTGTGTATVTASNFQYQSPKPVLITKVSLMDSGQTIAVLSCPHPKPLISPSKITNYYGQLNRYAAFFANQGICTVTPTGSIYQTIAINHGAVYFKIKRQWAYQVSYQLTGSAHVTYTTTHTITHKKKGHKPTTTTTTTVTYSNSSSNLGTVSKSFVDGSQPSFTSQSFAMKYITGVQCSLVNGTVTCPTS
jgi:hypothetical protein